MEKIREKIPDSKAMVRIMAATPEGPVRLMVREDVMMAPMKRVRSRCRGLIQRPRTAVRKRPRAKTVCPTAWKA